jgi:dipeptidyl-peptidase-4
MKLQQKTKWYGALFGIIAAFCLGGISAAEELTIERLVASPSLSGPGVRGLKMSPDGTRITFLKGKEKNFRQTDLWAYDVATGETAMLVDSDLLLPEGGEQIDEVEKARRERLRISTTGIVSYQWSPDGKALLFPVSGDIYYYDFDGRPKQLTATEATETDPKISPKGGYVSYVREQNIYVYDLESGEERAFTTEGGGNISFGMAQFVVQEELGRLTGYWWAPDDSRIAFTRIDESDVPELTRYEISGSGVTTIQQRYPLAGTTNATVELFTAPISDGSDRTEVKNKGRDTDDIYLVRVHWGKDSETLYYQILSRDQKTMWLMEGDIATGAASPVAREKSKTWINVHDDFHLLKDGRRYIWSSEKSGFRHLYLRNVTGGRAKQLTRGKWQVNGLVSVDEGQELVYFTGHKDGALERHLYVVDFDGKNMRRLTEAEGWHGVSMPKKAGDVFIDRYSAPGVPPQVALRSVEDGALVAWLEENRLEEGHPVWPYREQLTEKEFGQLRAEDGQMLDYYVQKPVGFDPAKTYPAVVHVYGGPHGRTVRKSWGIGFNDILAANGYVVFSLDNRGAADRGVKFESPIYRNMGGPEVVDQKLGADFLAGLPYVDENRIGVWGWSYGGYMSVLMLAKDPGTYAAGVSVAPVTDWKLYDTAYTERYMGHPDEEAEAYEASSHFPYAADIADPLLLVHGMADDNVFFDNSVKLMEALQNERVPFELMTYPGKKHGIRGEDTRAHLWTLVLDFFDRELKEE